MHSQCFLVSLNRSENLDLVKRELDGYAMHEPIKGICVINASIRITVVGHGERDLPRDDVDLGDSAVRKLDRLTSVWLEQTLVNVESFMTPVVNLRDVKEH